MLPKRDKIDIFIELLSMVFINFFSSFKKPSSFTHKMRFTTFGYYQSFFSIEPLLRNCIMSYNLKLNTSFDVLFRENNIVNVGYRKSLQGLQQCKDIDTQCALFIRDMQVEYPDSIQKLRSDVITCIENCYQVKFKNENKSVHDLIERVLL